MRIQDQYAYFDGLSSRILDDETWGICAAALGNRKNCARFIDEFWPIKLDEKGKFDFNIYLRNLHTGVKKRTPAECEKYWKEAKSKFIEALQVVQEEYGEIKSCYQKLKEIKGYLKDKSDKENQNREKSKYCEELVGQKEQLQVLYAELDDDFARCTSQMQELRNTLTFFRLRCLFQPKNKMIQQYKIIEWR